MKQKCSMKQKCLVSKNVCFKKKKKNLILAIFDAAFLFLRNEFSVENINRKFYSVSEATVF